MPPPFQPSEEQLRGLLRRADQLAFRFALWRPDYTKEDLLGAAHLGLTRALQEWDPGKNSLFNYASQQIQHAMIEWLRAQPMLGRPAQEKQRRLLNAERRLNAQYGTAEPPALATALGVSEETLERWQSEWNWIPQLQREQLGAVADNVDVSERALDANRFLALLPPRHAAVLRGLYLDDLTTVELGRRMGCDATRITQLRGEALRLLRRPLALPTPEPA